MNAVETAPTKEQEKSSFVGGYLTPMQKSRLAAVATLTGCSVQALLGRLADNADKLPGILQQPTSAGINQN